MVSRYNKVYVLSPAYFATGGTEALVVLCKTLRDLGVDASMYYVGCWKSGNPVPERFRYLDIPVVETVSDEEGSLLIVPETLTGYLRHYRKIKKAIWWLSVDNYINKIAYWGPRSLCQWFWKELCKFKNFGDTTVSHLCQSYYARDYVTKMGARQVAFLMDYLGAEHLQGSYKAEGREDVVLYNPIKGIRFTRSLIRAAGRGFRFVALQGMSPQQVHDWCSRAKVYIDFGNHPGKDRFPREAAMAGCLVVTSKNGAAAYYEDVPIPDRYKLSDCASSIPGILALIEDCFANYQERLADFDYYRSEIDNDKERFHRQVESLFLTEKFGC